MISKAPITKVRLREHYHGVDSNSKASVAIVKLLKH